MTALEAATASSPQVERHLAGTAGVAVLPFGALEQHGPHLPLSTDTLTALAVARRLAERLDALLLPAIPFGATGNMDGYPGTVSLRAATVAAIVEDVADGLRRAGARALVVVNGDWGNRAPILAALMRLAERDGLPAIGLDHPGLAEAAERVRESRAAAPGLMHAEEIETSLVLAVRPDLVGPLPGAVYPRFPSDFGTRPMRLRPFSSSGVFGDPAAASAEKGERLLEAVVAASMEVLADFLAALAR